MMLVELDTPATTTLLGLAVVETVEMVVGVLVASLKLLEPTANMTGVDMLMQLDVIKHQGLGLVRATHCLEVLPVLLDRSVKPNQVF